MCKTATLSPMVIASVWSWVTYSVATPTRLWMREISARICTRSLASRLERGSSIKNTDGSRTMARPMATRWRWPPESCPGLEFRYSVRPKQLGGLADLGVDLGLGELAQLQGEADVLRHGHVRVQGVVLEHHGHVAVLGGQVVDRLAAHAKRPGGDVLQARHHPKSRRLSRAGRSHQHHQLSLGDVQVQVGHSRQPVRVDLAHLFQVHSRHGVSLMAIKLISVDKPL